MDVNIPTANGKPWHHHQVKEAICTENLNVCSKGSIPDEKDQKVGITSTSGARKLYPNHTKASHSTMKYWKSTLLKINYKEK